MRNHRNILWTLTIVMSAFMPAIAPTAFAQMLPSLSAVMGEATEPEAPLATTPLASAPPVATKRAENQEMLRVAQRRLEAGDPTDSAAAQEVATYKTVEALLAQQEAVDRQIAELRSRQTELETQLHSTRAAGKKSQSIVPFIDFDRLKDELAAEEARVNLAAEQLAAAKTALDKAQTTLTKNESKRRQSQEAFEAGKDGPTAAELSTAFEQARQAANLAKETVTLRGKELKRGELSQEVQRLAAELKKEHVIRAAPFVVFSESDLQAQFAQIDKQEEAANTALATAQTRRQSAEEKVREAQRQLDEAAGDRAPLLEELAAQRRQQERWSNEVDLITQQLPRMAQLRMVWNHRFAIANAVRDPEHKPSSNDAKVWHKEAQAALEELSTQFLTRVQRMADLRTDLAATADKAEAAKDGAAAVIGSINAQRTQIDEMLRSEQASLMQIEASRRLYGKLLDELGENPLSPTKLAAGALEQVNDILNTEFTVGKGETAARITVIRAGTGLLVLVVGWLMSRLLSRVFSNRLLKRFHLSKDADAALRSMVYYSLLLIVLLVALNTVRVPLTAFTILGGALAIGVGFGSQALITNFIGGLIMLAERPIRLGEQINIGKFEGVVEEVGFRSTKLRTPTDHLVTIPNSTLVNDPIENVARRRTIRRLMNVTVNYGTPRQKLKAAVEAIRNILNEREIRERINPIVGFEQFPPRVYFNDYNAASLNIQVVYWYAPPDWWDYIEHCERVNYRIMEEFERLGVEFALPTTTVHVINEPPDAARTTSVKKPSGPADRRNVA